MLVNLNSTISNKSYSNSKTQNPSFKAINQKWLGKIIKDVDLVDNDFIAELLAGDVSKIDYIDTLEVAKKHYFPKFQDFFESTIAWAKKFDPNDHDFLQKNIYAI